MSEADGGSEPDGGPKLTVQFPASPLDRAFLTNQPGTGVLFLVRHGQQQHPEGPDAKLGEWVDPPLSERGERQAGVVGEALAAELIGAVYCSPLKRAHDTAQQIAKHHGLTPSALEELREIELFRDLPLGMSLRDAVAEPQLSGMRERFIRERRWDVYPFTEGSDEFRNRVVTTIEGILALHPAKNVAIACHGGVINAYIGHQLGLREDMFFRPGHASVSRLAVNQSRRIVQSLNETHHLAAADPALVTF